MKNESYKDVMNFSVHFTIKEQSIKDIENKFFNWANQNNLLHELKNELKVHSCTMPRRIVEERKWDLGIVEFIECLTDGNDINWFYSSNTIQISRLFMLENLKILNGIAVFIGEIKEGVKDEFDICNSLGIETILIP